MGVHPPGATSLLELASELIEHPLSISKREAFEQGLHDQARVIQELLEKDTVVFGQSTREFVILNEDST